MRFQKKYALTEMQEAELEALLDNTFRDLRWQYCTTVDQSILAQKAQAHTRHNRLVFKLKRLRGLLFLRGKKVEI